MGAKAIEKGIQGGGGIGFSGLEDGEDAETSSYKRLKTLVFDEHLGREVWGDEEKNEKTRLG